MSEEIAKYKLENDSFDVPVIKKDGHTMSMRDIVYELNRKSVEIMELKSILKQIKGE